MAANSGDIRLTELLASLSLATDLGTGQPLGHGLRTCLLSTRLASQLGCTADEVRAVHQVALLRFLGCTADAAETARSVGGDDLEFNAVMAPTLGGGVGEAVRAMAGVVGAGHSAPRRIRLLSSMLAHPGETARGLAAHCEVAATLARRLQLSERVVHALEHAYERWDGGGFPSGLKGADIPLEIRVCSVARDVELFTRSGEDPSIVLAERRGKAYDPTVVDAYHELGGWDGEVAWETLLAAEPDPPARIRDIDEALTVGSDFADLKSPYTRGHSRSVAELAADAAIVAGLGAERASRLRRAGLVHDLGRVGVENGVWDKPGPLSVDEWEKVQLHPYHTQRILSRCPSLSELVDVASGHHEREDGSGYHRRLRSESIDPDMSVLAAADVMTALVASRPHRPALTRDEAFTILEGEAGSGRLDAGAVSAVIEAAGGRSGSARLENPGSLTEREVEVLQLISRGLTNRQVGERLFISVKTVGRHVENIYAKIGVSTRAGAAVYAMQHRILV